MSLITETITSKVLGKEMNLSVYCPDSHEKEPLPVLYFLHGRTGNEQFIRQLEIDKTADKLISSGKLNPLIIVCPNMDNSRGINSSHVYQEIKGQYGDLSMFLQQKQRTPCLK